MPQQGQPLFRGVFAASVTPWAPGDRLDEAALWRHLEMMLAAGVDGICVGGSTGEFPRADLAARRRLLQATLEIVAGRVPVLLGAGHASLEGTLALLAAGNDAAAAVIPPPFYFPYSQADVLAFLRAVRERAEIPLVLYNIPQFTTAIRPETACRLLSDGLYAGIKDSSGEPAMLEAMAQLRTRLPFAFFCGADEQLPRAIELGADGALSGVAACAPELLVDLYRALKAGQADLAAEKHGLLARFIRRLEGFPPPVGIRLALEVRGVPVGSHATPLSPETEQRAAEFRHWLEEWLPLAIG